MQFIKLLCPFLIYNTTTAYLQPKGFNIQWQKVKEFRDSNSLKMSEYLDDEGQRKLKNLLNSQFGPGTGSVGPDEWCKPIEKNEIGVGTILLADPTPFYSGDLKTLIRFGLRESIPTVISPDRQAGLLPCILLVQHGTRYSYKTVANIHI